MDKRLFAWAILVCLCLPGAPATASETISYSYDELGRLVETRISATSTVNAGVATTIGYDPAGNRSSYAVTGSANMAAIDAAGGAALASALSTGLGGALRDSPAWQARTFRPEGPAGVIDGGQARPVDDGSAPTHSPF